MTITGQGDIKWQSDIKLPGDIKCFHYNCLVEENVMNTHIVLRKTNDATFISNDAHFIILICFMHVMMCQNFLWIYF